MSIQLYPLSFSMWLSLSLPSVCVWVSLSVSVHHSLCFFHLYLYHHKLVYLFVQPSLRPYFGAFFFLFSLQTIFSDSLDRKCVTTIPLYLGTGYISLTYYYMSYTKVKLSYILFLLLYITLSNFCFSWHNTVSCLFPSFLLLHSARLLSQT